MKYWDIEVVMTVRRTLTLAGPLTKDAARLIIEGVLRPDGISVSHFTRWLVPDGIKPMPCETIVRTGMSEPRILQISEVTETGAPVAAGRGP